jgi:hypothetical protein
MCDICGTSFNYEYCQFGSSQSKNLEAIILEVSGCCVLIHFQRFHRMRTAGGRFVRTPMIEMIASAERAIKALRGWRGLAYQFGFVDNLIRKQ